MEIVSKKPTRSDPNEEDKYTDRSTQFSYFVNSPLTKSFVGPLISLNSFLSFRRKFSVLFFVSNKTLIERSMPEITRNIRKMKYIDISNTMNLRASAQIRTN